MLFIVLTVTAAIVLLARRHATRTSSRLEGRSRQERQAMLEADLRARRERGGARGDGRLGEGAW